MGNETKRKPSNFAGRYFSKEKKNLHPLPVETSLYVILSMPKVYQLKKFNKVNKKRQEA